MPTLAGLLGAVDSVVTPAKRKLADLLRNPADYGQQHLGLMSDRAREWNDITKLATDAQNLDMRGSVMGGLPQYKQAQQQQLSGLLNVMPVGATVWHGSPHKFDKFDASKIGTGEGQQAYGHGVYFAEAPEVAQAYANKLTQVDGRAISDQLDSRVRYLNTLKQQAAAGDTNAAKNIPVMEKSIADLKNQGSLYKVDLPDEHIAKMLDWDKPVSEAQRAPISAAAMKQFGSGSTGTSGEHLYKEIVKEFERAGHKSPKEAATEFLRQQGVPGIKYLDAGSRGPGTGTSNFVVFPGNEGLLSILERNGQPLK